MGDIKLPGLKVRRALISVTDKTGVVSFAIRLAAMSVEIVSTGGTARVLREAGLAVKDVSEVTGFPEMMDGRLKTLHPNVHGGLLALRGNPQHMAAAAEHGIGMFDLVVVNLYAFSAAMAKPGATAEDVIENIDIGGPAMLRSAAKNFQSVAVVVDPSDYDAVAGEMESNDGCVKGPTRKHLALKVFDTTRRYDDAIFHGLAESMVLDTDHDSVGFRPFTGLPLHLTIFATSLQSLRYGENSHQQAMLYGQMGHGIAGAQQLGGKELSYNNLVDADAAWQLVCEFHRPACAIIKHTNPCGCAEADTPVEAYRKALACDPVSAFGSVIAFSWMTTVDEATATELAKLFVEVVIASEYTEGALTILQAKKGLRILQVALTGRDPVAKSISGGFLVQTPDVLQASEVDDAVLVTKREPTAEEWRALRFAWKVVAHVKSNAIVYAREGQLLGLGAGQPNRVNSAKIGAQFAVLPLSPCVVGSDAFFPFPDGVEEVIRNGATAIVQPGGSKNDQLAIDAANAAGIAMVFTGVRHFRH